MQRVRFSFATSADEIRGGCVLLSRRQRTINTPGTGPVCRDFRWARPISTSPLVFKTSQMLGNFGAFAAFRTSVSDLMCTSHQRLRNLPLGS
jgi:hypothetical protein